MLSLGTPKSNGIGDLIKRLILCLRDEEENEDDGCGQDDREHDVSVLSQPILEEKKNSQLQIHQVFTCSVCHLNSNTLHSNKLNQNAQETLASVFFLTDRLQTFIHP